MQFGRAHESLLSEWRHIGIRTSQKKSMQFEQFAPLNNDIRGFKLGPHLTLVPKQWIYV